LFTATSRLHSQVQPSITNATQNQSKQELFQFFFRRTIPLVEEAEELASNVLAASLLVVHDTGGGGQDNVTELTGGKELSSPLLEVTELDGVAGVDDTTLVEAAVKLDDNLAGAVVIDLLELANVAVLLHDSKELDDDLGGRTDEDLALAGLLGVVHGVERIVEDGSLDHFGGLGIEILKSFREKKDYEVSVR